MSSEETVQVAFGRGHLPLKIPLGAEVTTIRKAILSKLPDQRAAILKAFSQPVGFGIAGRACPRQEQCLHSDMRHHAAGAELALPAADDRNHDVFRYPTVSHHGVGGYRTSPPERGRGACGARWRSVGVRQRASGKPFCAERRRPRRFWRDGDARYTREN